MAYPHHLETFIRQYLMARGAPVEQTSYGVLTAVVDNQLEKSLGKEEWLFAFDYDASVETPGSEFITYGNATLEKIVCSAVQGHRVALRYCTAAAHLPGSIVSQIASHLGRKSTDFEIGNAKRYLVPIVRFKFKVAYLSDDREEELIHVWIDGHDGKDRNEYAGLKHIVYDASAPELLPELPQLPPPRLLHSALDALMALTTSRTVALQSQQHHALRSEIARTEAYFSEMIRDGEAKVGKAMAVNDGAHADTLQSKIESIKLQNKHHIQDIEQKYRVRCEVELIDAILYMVPRWRLSLTLLARARKQLEAVQQKLFWDPILSRVVD